MLTVHTMDVCDFVRKKRKALYAVAGERQGKAHALKPDGCLGFLDPFSRVSMPAFGSFRTKTAKAKRARDSGDA